VPARTAYAEDLQGIAVQGALRDDDPTALQQLVGLFDRELVVDEPGLQLVVVGLDHRPGRTVAIGPVRSHPLADLADQLVGDLGFSSACDQAADESGLEVAADVFLSTEDNRSIERKPSPRSHSRRTSRISNT
jgi:hypothetical protein